MKFSEIPLNSMKFDEIPAPVPTQTHQPSLPGHPWQPGEGDPWHMGPSEKLMTIKTLKCALILDPAGAECECSCCRGAGQGHGAQTLKIPISPEPCSAVAESGLKSNLLVLCSHKQQWMPKNSLGRGDPRENTPKTSLQPCSRTGMQSTSQNL